MTGIILLQVGTPDAPTAAAVRPYLRQFLADRRIIESPAARFLVKNVIVPFRARSSAEKYARVWDPATGSPLMHHTVRQTEELAKAFPAAVVRFGMGYGNPQIVPVVREMVAAGVDRLIAVPMFPQYSATTTASVCDGLFHALSGVRRVPAVRVVPPYYDHPGYIAAMADVIRDDLNALGWTPDHFVFSFHGIPQKYAKRGDPYATHVVRTTRLLVKELGWRRDQWTQTFQSRFGRSAWLKPYTDDVLERLAAKGMKRVFVALPGFTADCLETIDEIGHESEEVFHKAGGEKLRACPCLNEHPRWVAALADVVRREGAGWV
jgi:protoporphyrin/coproporphyrin ferrochelatase